MMSEAARQIVDAASVLFAQRGYSATTTRAIATEAGVTEVTIFRAFGNKQGILRAIGDRLAHDQAGHVAGDLPAQDVRSALRELARREVANGLAQGALVTRLAFEAGSVPEVAEVLAEGPASTLEALADFLAQAQRRGDVRADIPARTLAEGFFALTSSFVITRTILGGVLEAPDELNRTVSDLFELFWSGASPLAARGEAR